MGLHILLDFGHGVNTPGKRSPITADGRQLMEFESNRRIGHIVARKLDKKGISNEIIVHELFDVKLSQRVARVNHIALRHGVKNCLLLSLHSNAGGGTGFEFFTSPGKTMSDEYAEIFCEEAAELGFPVRTDTTDGDKDKEANFTMITDTLCPAILVENLFMDTDKDLEFLLSEDGPEKIADYIVKAIVRCIDYHLEVMNL